MQEQIQNINSLEELQALYTATFGKNGTMTARLKQMATLDNDARIALNKENTTLRELFKNRQTELETAELNKRLASESIDVTLDTEPENNGSIHPLTHTLMEITSIFESLGFEIFTGPEVEDDWHNFTALNTPSYHPARDMQDTFFFENGKAAKVDMATYATKTNRRKLIGAYSDKSPLVAMFHLPQDAELALFSTENRCLLMHTASLAPKTTRATQGVAVMTLKTKYRLERVERVENTGITNHSRYRTRTLPAAGTLVKEEDSDEKQLELL